MALGLPNIAEVAVDTETSGLHPDDGARVSCVGLAWEGGSTGLPFDQGTLDKFPVTQLDLLEQDDPNLGKKEWRELLVWLAGRKLIFHNAKYDLAMLIAGTRHWAGGDLSGRLVWDTMITAGELDPREPRGLDEVAKRAELNGKSELPPLVTWLKANKYKPSRYDLAPWRLAEPYVVGDAEATFALYKLQKERVERGEVDRKRLRREHRLLATLFKMEQRGVEYDAGRSLEGAERLEDWVAGLEKGIPFSCDINSAKRYFFDTMGLSADRTTEKGNPTLDEEQVRKWAADGVEWAKEYSQVSRAKRAVSMWYRGYPEKIGLDGRLRCVFRQGSVKSGRMSVERIQLQAMPKDDKAPWTRELGVPSVRSLLRAKKGHGLWSLDLSQAELRIAARYAECERMLELLREGADLHGVTCEQVLGVKPRAPDWKVKRDIAKRLTFGAIFMIGGKTFQETLSRLADIHLSLAECERLVGDWRQLYPEFATAYWKSIQAMERRGCVRLLPGTPYETRSWMGPHDYPQGGWSRKVQGSLAEFFKLWMIEIEATWPGLMVLTVHDSVVLELPNERRPGHIAKEIATLGEEMATDLLMGDCGVRMPVEIEKW